VEVSRIPCKCSDAIGAGEQKDRSRRTTTVTSLEDAPSEAGRPMLSISLVLARACGQENASLEATPMSGKPACGRHCEKATAKPATDGYSITVHARCHRLIYHSRSRQQALWPGLSCGF
jgi:hypothetical protein